MSEVDEPVEDSAAIEFAKLMIPEVNRALFPDRYAGKPAPAAEPADTEAATADDAAPAQAAPAEAVPGETSGHAPAGETAAPAAAAPAN